MPEAMAHIEHHAIRRFGLRRRAVPAPSRWLGELPIEGRKLKKGSDPSFR
jgi:hypothetical protein